MAGKFAFMIHPLDVADVSRKFSFARHLPESVVEGALRLAPPLIVSEITGIESPHNTAAGWFVACTLTSRQITRLPQKFVIDKIIRTGRVAEKLGARVLGLGAFTAVVGDAGISVARALDIGVTTGNSYTAATAIEGAAAAAKFMGIDMKQAHVAIVGATGSIGRAAALIVAPDCGQLTLVGRSEEKLDRLAEEVRRVTGKNPRISKDIGATLPQADVVITVSSAVDTIIEPQDLKVGAVVCDVARPRDVSRQVAEQRDDVLVIEGGVVDIPGDVDFALNFGYPPKTAMACMAETMMLALEERYDDFTLGREYDVEQILQTQEWAKKHGFKLSGFRSFERALTSEELNQIRDKARQKKAKQRGA